MIFTDIIWGKVKIIDPLVLEIINTPEMQRLKDINQAGYPLPFLKNAHFARFEHCLGVYLLLTKYHASQEECLAGLIHDVSHGVFSHALDYVLTIGSEKEQSHQDNVHPEYVKKSSINTVLKKAGLNVEYLLDDRHFPLKETKLPDLCADRIDYGLREGIVYKILTPANVKNILKNLVVIDDKWIFSDFETAAFFAKSFLELNNKYWASLSSASMFRTTGDYLKYSLKKKYISEDDLYTTDNNVLNKIEPFQVKDKELTKLWQQMNNKVKISNNSKDFTSKVHTKSRVVNPLCLNNGKIIRVSEIDKHWQKILEVESQPKEYFLKFAD